jgi:xylan 1,4-beta-xylosidase
MPTQFLARLLSIILVCTAGLINFAGAGTDDSSIRIEVNLDKASGPLDHIWSKSAGSDRAAITLREQWRKDLTRFHQETGLERVRFHGIFADELEVYSPSWMNLTKEPNWQNVDRIYDGLLERGVRPYVELSFMPKRLTKGTSTFGFYRALTSPPDDMAAWGTFIKAFTQHLVDRYGIDEVRQWMFEVWNEPNLKFFWSGTQQQYFDLYKATVTAVKSVDSNIMVGGPSTAMIGWIPEFLAYAEKNNLSVDFVSTHIYPADDQRKIFGKKDAYSQNDVIPAAMALVRKQIDRTKYKGAPLWLSEWSSDSPAMIAHVIKGNLGVCAAMSQWTFTNTYEELGVSPYVLKEGDKGFGMMAVAGIPLPQFNTYKLLHRLGTTRLRASDGPVLASRLDNGDAAIAVWNLADVSQSAGIPGVTWERKVNGTAKQIHLKLKGAKPSASVKVSFVDRDRGSPFPEWRKLGSPQYPTMSQIEQIRKSAELPEPTAMNLDKNGELVFDLPPEGIALVELAAPR